MTDTWQLSAVASLVEDIDKKNSRRSERQLEHRRDVAIVRPVCEHRVRKRGGTNDRWNALFRRTSRIIHREGRKCCFNGDVDEAIELKGLTWVENDEIRQNEGCGNGSGQKHGLIARNLDMLLDD